MLFSLSSPLPAKYYIYGDLRLGQMGLAAVSVPHTKTSARQVLGSLGPIYSRTSLRDLALPDPLIPDQDQCANSTSGGHSLFFCKVLARDCWIS